MTIEINEWKIKDAEERRNRLEAYLSAVRSRQTDEEKES